MNQTNDEFYRYIQEQLTHIENKYGIRILHCAESGSRAWGFASPDSDYDVRFIYVRPKDHYLQLQTTPDFLEVVRDSLLDINGWDLDKALKLLHKSNPTLFEWNNSPIVYKTTKEWGEVRAIINKYFTMRSGLMHYLNTAEGNYREYLRGEEVKIKKYFYVLRPLLACRYILDHQSPPPMLFQKLVDEYLSGEILDEVNKLLTRKMSGGELGVEKRIDPINKWVDQQILDIEEKVQIYGKDEPKDWDELNALFLKLIS